MALACAPRLGAHAAQVSPAGTRRALAACFQVAGASVTDQRVMIFVGPTGVGKTTTVAKLAGQLGRRWGRRIALVTLDTYRIGAVAQMRIYAELLAAPLTVAQRPAELAAAIRGLDAETVLVDTSGRSPASREGMQRLTGFLDVLPEADVHLVISATTKGSDVEATIRAFRQARYRYLVLTKLDEARTPGPVLAVAVKHGLPVSFLGTGQEVPDDLELATCHRLATLLLPDGTGRRREE
jgi:flagellar biosynthesis protein FlhF